MLKEFGKICNQHGYTMVHETMGEIVFKHGVYRIILENNKLFLMVKREDWVELENQPICDTEIKTPIDLQIQLIHYILNSWAREYYLTPGYAIQRDCLLSDFEHFNYSGLEIVGNQALEDLLISVYKKGLRDATPFC